MPTSYHQNCEYITLHGHETDFTDVIIKSLEMQGLFWIIGYNNKDS